MKAQLVCIGPVNEDQKREVVEQIERLLNRSDMKDYMELRQIPNRTKLFKALRYSRPRNYWRLEDAERDRIAREEEVSEAAALTDLINAVDLEDLLAFYCEKCEISRIESLFYYIDSTFNMTIMLSNVSDEPTFGGTKEEKDETSVETDKFISFSRPSDKGTSK